MGWAAAAASDSTSSVETWSWTSAEDSEETDNCTICLEPLDPHAHDEPYYAWPCMHQFHADCINQHIDVTQRMWGGRRPSQCPNCRRPVSRLDKSSKVGAWRLNVRSVKPDVLKGIKERRTQEKRLKWKRGISLSRQLPSSVAASSLAYLIPGWVGLPHYVAIISGLSVTAFLAISIYKFWQN